MARDSNEQRSSSTETMGTSWAGALPSNLCLSRASYHSFRHVCAHADKQPLWMSQTLIGMLRRRSIRATCQPPNHTNLCY